MEREKAVNMSTRDYFAGCALTGLIMGHPYEIKGDVHPETIKAISETAIIIADEMMKARGAK